MLKKLIVSILYIGMIQASELEKYETNKNTLSPFMMNQFLLVSNFTKSKTYHDLTYDEKEQLNKVIENVKNRLLSSNKDNIEQKYKNALNHLLLNSSLSKNLIVHLSENRISPTNTSTLKDTYNIIPYLKKESEKEKIEDIYGSIDKTHTSIIKKTTTHNTKEEINDEVPYMIDYTANHPFSCTIL